MSESKYYRGRDLRIILVITGIGLLLAIFFSGCIEKPKESPVGTPSSVVPPAPKQLYLHPNTTENFNFWGHDVSINYLLQNSNHIIEITIDGNKETIIKSITEPCHDCSYGKKVGNINYVIRPVTWITNEAGEKVWSFDTWNTSELYFEMVIEGIRSK